MVYWSKAFKGLIFFKAHHYDNYTSCFPGLHSESVYYEFLSDPGVPGVRSMGPDVRQSVRPRGFADLTDVTLADEDSNSIPTDDVNG